ncbi:MAG: exodeoxyribonuclease VII small subunit [Proteobacteria bacterium]|jgi:exodeoxyribonuclease VII small subunit|nr:exodeoxyribonuclease VII small subunit [Pseudomonadota bacterium]MDA1011368.1 exodeoxyribonuclease VII small subunit [Pseudomonadota bacterium]|tara:strand:- start:34 stop:273 length:240 start_codon:yes stop_codon:yes gene_type:complete
MTKAKEKLTFESALTELEVIVEKMEDDDTTLENSLSFYKRGVELLQFCQKELEAAQREVSVLEAGILKKFEGIDESKLL